MNEGQAKNRLGHGPQNFAVLRHMALNVMQKDLTKGSLRGNSNTPAGMKPISQVSLLCSEMRLPWHECLLRSWPDHRIGCVTRRLLPLSSDWRAWSVRGSMADMAVFSPDRGFRSPAEVIQHAVWLYH